MRRRSQSIFYKTDDEIELIRHSCQLVGKTHAEVAKFIKPGVTTKRLDEIAEAFILDNDAIPGFKGYGGFPATLCISMNDAIVHGIPDNYEIKEGDVISIDCGVIANHYYGDSAYTYCVGEVSDKVMHLLTTTKASLYKGIEQAVAGKRVGDISFAIQQYTEKKHGYGVVRELVGHGVGRNLHEAPEVPNFGRRGRGVKLKDGLVIAIEPMINQGRRDVIRSKDNWTILTADGLVSAHYEHTVAVRKKQADILSTFEYLEEAIKNNEELVSIA